jgi:thiol-disulfide isomerase/thioredoxin
VKTVLSGIAVTALFLGVALSAGAGEMRKAPELAYSVPVGGQQTPKLLSQYRGKVVALEFIFTTCPHCQHASVLMTKLQQEYASRGFQALDVAINDNADLLVENFVRDFQVGFPVGWTTRDQFLTFMSFSFADRFVVPQLVLIDRKGEIHYQTPALGNGDYEKQMQESTIRSRIEELLNSDRTTSTKHSSGTGVLASKR